MTQQILSHNDVSYPAINNSFVVKALLSNRTWEKKITALLHEHITPDMTVVDAGAYIGSHTLTMAGLSSKVYAFEPQPVAAECIRRTIKAKKLGHVFFHEVGLNDVCKTDFIFTNGDGDASLSGIRDHKFKANFPCRTAPLDSFIGETENVGLMKIDVEGSEWRVLEGAAKTIRRCRPIIIMETFNTKKNLKLLDAWIKENDYTKEYISAANYLVKPRNSGGGPNGRPIDVLMKPLPKKLKIIN
jgi:FkbM family methyltransferase